MTTGVQSDQAVRERLGALPARLAARDDFGRAPSALSSGQTAEFDGVWGGSCAPLAAALAPSCPATLLIVCPRESVLEDLVADLDLLTDLQADRFPAWQSLESDHPLHDDLYGERLRTLKRMLRTTPPLLAASVQALLQPAPGRQTLEQGTRHLRVGDRVDADELSKWLAAHRFQHTTAVALPGEYSIRGGIFDIFAPEWTSPVRIELWDDEIESLRRFDLATQRSIASIEAVEISATIRSSQDNGRLIDYLAPGSWVLLVEPEQVEAEARSYLERSGSEDAGSQHRVLSAALARFPLATASTLAVGSGQACRLPVDSIEQFSGEVGRVRDELDRIGEDQQVIVVDETEAEIQRLREILEDGRLMTRGQLQFAQGSLSAGFRIRLDDERLILVSGRELFHRGQLRRGPARRHLGKAIDSFLDLREGDLVVHLAHGIGRYRGLELLNKDGQVEEHLQLEFHGGTKIYVPADRIGLVQKYVGGSKSRPRLARIGSKSWVRQKRAAAAAVQDMAAEMLEMQAHRAARPGIAFPGGSTWQREFDASFPYDETPDQLNAQQAIRFDMQTARPMDRLLCGDVGYGKTELAMRAAFAAVDSGYQVAVLVPTTILAEQHHHTFVERMAAFPFEIAKLSRFASTQQQREVIEGLAAGRVDIVIGTHRLASRDVSFFNLGLVIIDEEQRFGVQVKERLKSLRSQVDVLTLSATPIPRTLHMSLVGVRDISNLETPPEERLAVETKVTRFQHQLIRDAVLQELNRDGQIYFVHNRVQDIEVVADKLQRIVPEARLRIAHGQMHESDLERVMVDFVAHRFDLLLATTIVESGLDIPNANTIFIDEADCYGLADLHQLRGRVGRYKNKAYCYLLIDPRKSVTPNAARRLRAIEEYSEMGAGFAIAMRDLEIRGAGNLLGTQQSGHITAVGYELYCQLLEEAVRQLRQAPQPIVADAEIDLPGEAYLPPDYLGDMRLKIDLYRRLSRINAFDQLEEFHQELLDRFGPPPAQVQRLMEKSQLRLEAAVWQITRVSLEEGFLVFRFASRPRIAQLAKSHGRRLRIVDEQTAYYPLDENLPAADVLAVAKSVLRPD